MGVKFDRKKFSRDFVKFEGALKERKIEQSASQSSGHASGKKRKKKKTAQEVCNNDVQVQGLDVFSGSQAGKQPASASDSTHESSKAQNLKASRDPFEEGNALRKEHKIRVSGSAIPNPLQDFSELKEKYGARKRLLDNLRAIRFCSPTPIQRQAITVLLGERELLAVAPTGSGKTMAYLLPIVMGIVRQRRGGENPEGPSALIVSPTRELALQINRCLDLLTANIRLKHTTLSKSTVSGTDFSKVDVLIGTPQRLSHHTKSGELDLSNVRVLILDEGDRLFDLGFLEQVDDIVAACSHPDIIRGLFSATLPDKVEELARNVLRDPVRITVGERNIVTSSVEQHLKFVGSEDGRALALRQMLRDGVEPPVLVFVASKERAQALHKKLAFDGLRIDCIHSDQSPAARNAAVEGFRSGTTWVLIATDLVGRGMDFLGVKTVVNYDFPNSTVDYIHRVGRTGRAGQKGKAITLFTEEDGWQLRSVANVMREAGCEVPAWMLALRKTRGRELREKQRERRDRQREETQALLDSVAPRFERKRREKKAAMVKASKRRRA